MASSQGVTMNDLSANWDEMVMCRSVMEVVVGPGALMRVRIPDNAFEGHEFAVSTNIPTRTLPLTTDHVH